MGILKTDEEKKGVDSWERETRLNYWTFEEGRTGRSCAGDRVLLTVFEMQLYGLFRASSVETAV